jgi:hypothetical protein
MTLKTVPHLTFFLLLAGCHGTTTIDPGPTEAGPGDDFLVHSSFALPSQGTPNHNTYVGPFCCTGVTAVVDTTSGFDAGYAYFYGWKGQAFEVGDKSYAPDLQILIAGLADAHDPQSMLVKGEIDFAGSEMTVGAQRTSTAGQLSFTVTIEQVSIVTESDGPYFDMGTLTAGLDVAITP